MADLTSQIIAYEEGELEEQEMIELFQTLINNGMAWTLQGHYGRTATQLIEAGLCNAKYVFGGKKISFQTV